MKTIKNTLLVLSTGYIFVYFSEHLFWARIRPDDSIANWVSTWIAYSLAAFVFLSLVQHFRVSNFWSLFLAAAIFGWLTEGLIVQTTYEALPLSISFTGLAWHAIITVGVGWYALRQSLLSLEPFSTLKLASVVGFAYGLWAISWWVEPDGGVSPAVGFAIFSVVTTLLLIVSYLLVNWSSTEPFTPNRWMTRFIGGIFILYFALVTIPAAPIAAIILPILLGLAVWGLRKSQPASISKPFTESIHGPIPILKAISMLALPAAAIAVYTVATFLQLQWHTNWMLYLIITPLGFILFGFSLYRAWHIPPAELP